jgi:hypothetical protein
MNTIQEKIVKSSKIMAIVLKAVCILLIIGLVVPIATIIWIQVDPNADINPVNGGFYSITGMPMESTGEVIAEMCTIILMAAFMLAIFIIAYSMFRTIIKDAVPFTRTNAKSIKKISVLLFIYSIVVPIARTGFYRTFAPSIDYRGSFDETFLLLALIFYFISIVFDYGAELQRQSDELL